MLIKKVNFLNSIVNKREIFMLLYYITLVLILVLEVSIKNMNFDKSLKILFLMILLWSYINFCLGYFLYELVYNFFGIMHKRNLFENIRFKKIFNSKNMTFLVKFVFNYISESVKDWWKRVCEKTNLISQSVPEIIRAMKIFKKKFKSILQFKRNFLLIKNLLIVFWQAFKILCSFISEFFVLFNMFKFLLKSREFALILISEYVVIIKFVYVIYFILIGLFSVLMGFLLSMYKTDKKIYVLTILIFLQSLYINVFNSILFESNKIKHLQELQKLNFKPVKQIRANPSKLIFQKLDQSKLIPLPILIDPFILIDVEIVWKKELYEFELLKFCQEINKKIKK
jgi:hypothetical protein